MCLIRVQLIFFITDAQSFFMNINYMLSIHVCKQIVYYLIGGPYVNDHAGLNRGPLIQNRFIVTLYTLL